MKTQMKTTKRIISAVVVALMIVAMFAMPVSAANNTLTLNCDKEGYTFSVFQIATLDTATGAYTVTVNDASIKAEIEKTLADIPADSAAAVAKSASIAKYLDTQFATATDDAVKAVFSGDVQTYTSTGAPTKTISVEDGLYYVIALKSGRPASAKSVQGSVIALPYYESNTWTTSYTANLSELKLLDASVDKKIVASDEYITDTNGSAAITDETTPVKFELSASVVGSASKQVDTYYIGDIMDNNLKLNADSIEVKLTNGSNAVALTKNVDYTVETTVPNTADTNAYTFVVKLSNNVVNTTTKFNGTKNFYDFTKVVVTYTATLDVNAPVNTAMPNENNLTYKNKGGSDYTLVEGDKVNVYALGVSMIKVSTADKSENPTKIAGAVYGLYTMEGKQVATVTSSATGNATFMTMDGSSVYNVMPGVEYYIKEIKAPAGFALSQDKYSVKLDATVGSTGVNVTAENYADGLFNFTCKDSPIIMPATGGTGTMIFTITGASLIALAGVLMVISKRKNAAN